MPPAGAGGSGNPLAIWYVVIGQEQVGPLTGAEVRRRFATREILPSYYVWCEGYAEWLPIEAAPGLEDLMIPVDDSGPVTRRVRAEDYGQAGLPESGPAPGAPVSEVEDDDARTYRIGQESPAGSNGSGRCESTQRVSLDDIVAMYPAEAEALVEGAASSAKTTSQLKGQRSEHSVLFRIGRDEDEDEDDAAPAETGSRPGYASVANAGSGLVDVREMARTVLEGPGAEVTDRLVVSAPAALTAPVVAPAGRTGLPRWIWGVMVGAVLVVGLVAALVTVLLLRGF